MKKSLTIIFCVSLILILSFSVVSGSWFGDFWAKITGKSSREVNLIGIKH